MGAVGTLSWLIPFRLRQVVRIIRAIDVDVFDMIGHIGRVGTVDRMQFEHGSGWPDDPVILVRFPGRKAVHSFWREELEVVMDPFDIDALLRECGEVSSRLTKKQQAVLRDLHRGPRHAEYFARRERTLKSLEARGLIRLRGQRWEAV